MLKRSNGGFTLVESLLGASIGIVASGVILVVAVNAASIWQRTAKVLELDGQATLAMEDIRANLRGSQPAIIDTVAVNGITFDRIRYIRGQAFDPLSGDIIWSQEFVITAVPDTAQASSSMLVLQSANGITMRTIARQVTAFIIDEPSTDSTLAPDELRVTISLSAASLAAPVAFSSVISTRQGFETVVLREAENGAQSGAPWTIVGDASASAGSFIQSSANGNQTLLINFSVPSAGRYYVWARGRSIVGTTVNFNNRPFNFRIFNDPGAPGNFFPWGGVPFNLAWQWYLIEIRNLVAGNNWLEFSPGNGSGARPYALDRILVTSKANLIPTF